MLKTHKVLNVGVEKLSVTVCASPYQQLQGQFRILESADSQFGSDSKLFFFEAPKTAGWRKETENTILFFPGLFYVVCNYFGLSD